MANVRLYRTYRFIDKDPIIDEVRTLIQDEGLMKKLDIVHQLSGVATTTLDNWFNGETVSPQNRTISAVVTSLGYQRRFVRDHKIDIERELKLAAAWNRRQDAANEKAKATTSKRKTNEHHQRAGAQTS